MKANALFILCSGFIPVLALSGSSPNKEVCVPCLVAPDTLPAEIIKTEVVRVVDSVRADNEERLRQAKLMQDSSFIRLALLVTHQNKELILLKADTTDSTVSRSYYWKYSSGKLKHYKTLTFKL